METTNNSETQTDQVDYRALATQYLIEFEIPAASTVDTLVEKGIDREEAVRLVKSIKVPKASGGGSTSGGVISILLGLLFLGGGIFASIAIGNVLFYGAIIYGGFKLIMGIVELAQS